MSNPKIVSITVTYNFNEPLSIEEVKSYNEVLIGANNAPAISDHCSEHRDCNTYKDNSANELMIKEVIGGRPAFTIPVSVNRYGLFSPNDSRLIIDPSIIGNRERAFGIYIPFSSMKEDIIGMTKYLSDAKNRSCLGISEGSYPELFESDTIQF